MSIRIMQKGHDVIQIVCNLDGRIYVMSRSIYFVTDIACLVMPEKYNVFMLNLSFNIPPNPIYLILSKRQTGIKHSMHELLCIYYKMNLH